MSRNLGSKEFGMQMNLLFYDTKPMVLPEDQQRELAMALADLLLNAVVEPRNPGEEEQE